MADTQATWREATDNVRAGGVVFSDNHPFIISRYESTATGYHLYSVPDNRSTLTIKVSGQEEHFIAPNDNIITFKNGNYFGLEYISYNNILSFQYIEGEDIIGYSTVSNKPYTHSSVKTYPRIFYVNIGGQDYPVYTREISETFVYETEADYYYISSFDYISRATNETIGYEWLPSFPGSIPTARTGIVTMLGYPNQQPIIDFLAGNTSSKPQYPGDASSTGGGNGTFYDDNYEIPFSDCPGINAIDLGFTSIYVPDVTTCQNIARWLWSDDFDESIKLNYISPFDNIISLSIVPIDLSNHTISGILRVGNVDSDIACDRLVGNQQYQSIDCGTLFIQEKWGNFLDYNSNYALYLPMIGYRSLKPDDLVNGNISIHYWADVLTGNVVAEVGTEKQDGIFHVLYTYNGNMFYNLAFSGANFMSMYNQQLSATSSGLNNAVQSLGQMASGNVIGALGGLTSLFTGQQMAQRQYETAKPDYGRGGNNGGNSGLFSCRYPYLIQCRAIEQVPDNYRSLQGIPAQLYRKLGDLTGYTEIESVIVNTLTCTEEEQIQIVQQLKEGVIL